MSTNVEAALKQSIADLEYIAQHPGSVLTLLEKRRDELTEMTYVREHEAEDEEEHARLLKDLEHARNYSYEANMGDYSMASINSAKAQVDAAKQALTDAGYEVPTW